MPRERKPLITPGSVLPAQGQEGGDVMSRIIARDREKRGSPDDTDIQEYRNEVIQEPVMQYIQEPVNAGVQLHRNTASQAPVDKVQKPPPGGIQEPVNTGILKSVNTEIQQPILEPTDKATFDLPRSLHQQLKIRAAIERRPARAILIDLLTQYLQEEAS